MNTKITIGKLKAYLFYIEGTTRKYDNVIPFIDELLSDYDDDDEVVDLMELKDIFMEMIN